RVAPQAAAGVEHERRVEQLPRHRERAAGVAGEEDSLGEVGGRPEMCRFARDRRRRYGRLPATVAKRRTSPPALPDAVRDAVERTVQATIGQAQTTRERTQRAADDLVRGAEESAKSVRKAIEGGRPATHDELRDLQEEVRALARRLDAIEKRLPARSGSTSRAKKS